MREYFFQIKTHINSETKVLYHKNGKHILIIRIKIEGGKNMRNDDSYEAYKKLASLSFADYWSSDFSKGTKKKNFLQNLPTDLGYKIFRKRFGS